MHSALNSRKVFISLWMAGGLIFAAAPARAAGSGPFRFQSPSGRFDILVRPLSDDWTHVQKAKDGVARESMKQYEIDFYAAKATEPVNSLIYSDLNPPVSPEEVIRTLAWSAQEEFVLLPDRVKARAPRHVLLLVASLSTNKIWGSGSRSRSVDRRASLEMGDLADAGDSRSGDGVSRRKSGKSRHAHSP